MNFNSDFDEESIFLRKGDDVVGLHATGYISDQGFQQIEAWCNAYDTNFKYLGSIYRIFGLIEMEAENLMKDGWVEVEGPKEIRK